MSCESAETISDLHSVSVANENSPLSTLKKGVDVIIQNQSQTAAQSAPALARSLAPGALSRVGRIALDEKTDPKVVLTAAKLILWATGLSEPPGEGEQELELRFSPEDADGD